MDGADHVSRPAGQPRPIKAGLVVSFSSDAARDGLDTLAHGLVEEIGPELHRASGRPWRFRFDEPMRLGSDERRHAGDFLGEASIRLVEGDFDLIVILTDVPLISRRERTVFGLSSPLTRTLLMSTHRLRATGRAVPPPMDAAALRWNSATLLLHLIGQTLELGASRTGAMSPFRYDPERTTLPRFAEVAALEQRVRRFVAQDHSVRGPAHELWIHARAVLRHPGTVVRALVRNRAPLLPLSMSGLTAAAVAPVFVLVFSAEFWDAGLGISPLTAATYAAISILAATLYLCFARKLFLPRKEAARLPEHLAVANSVIFFSMLLAIIGLFTMVLLLVLAVELWIFPADLISTWPTLQNQDVRLPDLLRIAVFISTVGITTGALAGGLQRRQLMRDLALFRREV